MKNYILPAISLLLILSLCGCGADAVQSAVVTPEATIMLTSTAEPTLSPIPSPTAQPTPSPTLAEVDSDLQAQLAAPEIDGLTKGIQDSSVIYTYVEGNSYGGKVGEYAGVYKENIYVEGKKTGGVCLAADVCLVLLHDALAEIPEGEDKFKIIVPLDITNYDEKVEIDNVEVVNHKDIVYSFIGVQCLCSVPIVNVIPDVSSLAAGGVIFHNNDIVLRSIINFDAYNNFDPELAFMNVGICSDGTELNEMTDYDGLYYGSQLLVKDVESIIYVVYAISGEAANCNTDFLIVIDGRPVFIVAEEPES